MTKMTKLSLVAALALSLSTSATANETTVSANVAITSDYIWRGMTQNVEDAAIQGGFDIENGNYYAGTWASNVKYGDSTIELDYYVGFANEVAGIGYDLSYGAFTYPGDTTLNFEETTLSLSKSINGIDLGLAYSKGMNEATNNVELSVSTMGIDLAYGDYDEVGTYYTVSHTRTYDKFDATLTYSSGLNADTVNNAGADEDSKVFVTISSSF